MYCRKCGKQIADDSTFCRYCGAKTEVSTVDKREHDYPESDNQLLFTYRPEFHGGYIIAKLIPAFIFLSIFISFIISFIRGLIAFTHPDKSPYDQLPGISTQSSPDSPFDHFFQLDNFLIGITITFLLVIVLGYILKKKRYEHSIYQFYSDHMEYIDGYFNYNKKQISYKNIQEFSMSQNVFQRKYGIGSIRITTSGMTYRNDRAYSNGISIYDLANIDSVYSELKKIIK